MAIAETLTLENLRTEGVGIALEGQTFASFDFFDDEDYYVFSAQPNRIYSFTVDARVDTQMGLFTTPQLGLERRNDDGGPGLSPEILVQIGDAPETILIEVDTPLSREPGEDGLPGPLAAYVLEIEEVEVLPAPTIFEDRVGNSTVTGGGIVAGTPVPGDLETPDDVDAYVVWMDANRDYLLEVDYVGGDFDPFLEFFDGLGAPIDANDDTGGGTDAALSANVSESGFYFVTASDADFDGTGSYEIAVTNFGAALPEDGPDQVGEVVDSAGLIEAGIPVAGRIEEPGDADLYGVVLLEGSEYLLGAVGYDGFDSAIILRDGESNALLTVDDAAGSRDALTLFTPEETGLYYIEVIGATSVETGDFDIGVFLLDPGETLASEARDIALIYEAGLNREADVPGLNFWIRAYEGTLSNGADPLSLQEISEAFLFSQEFEDAVGDPDVISDFELVTGLYENVLDREADDPGRDFWLSVLAQPDVDAADLLIAFARSAENVANSPTVDSIAYNANDEEWQFLDEDPTV
ncbi:MAG: DUF4214 domain-containing protein [Pseudomonadota bacterium]